uniref:Cytochrome P450 n=1 Tax=Kalanchoe fedtschenkoi TaxID=63787 RepID=A0A7N0UGC2_KALFE
MTYVTKIVFRKGWAELHRIKAEHEQVLIPLIRACKEQKAESGVEDHTMLSNVNSLLQLELPEEKRCLIEQKWIDIELNGHLIPKNGGTVNFMIAEMGWDPEVWKDLMEFKPERFLKKTGEVEFDITGRKEIKMMSFEAGRRICPAYQLSCITWQFRWTNVDEVSLEDKQEFTIVMKHPLHARL